MCKCQYLFVQKGESLQQTLIEIKELVKQVGNVQLEKFRMKGLNIELKSSLIDLVTDIDKLSERIIIKKLREAYPKCSILSEEEGKINNNSEYLWVIDPLDGTNNYANGIPVFAISIALQYKGDTILGVIYAPYINEMYTAIKGEGAYLNGIKIKIGEKDSLLQSVISTGFPYDKAINKANNISYATEIIPKIRGFRRSGSAAIDLAYVAAGFLDGYWEMNINPWDVEAGILLVKESGGKVIHFRDDRKISIIAGNKSICNLLLKEIQEVDKKGL